MTARPRPAGGGRPIVPDKFTPFRDRMVRTRVVTCPTCGAPPGVKCLTAKGTTMAGSTNYHRARRQAAIRAEREQA